MHHVPKPIKFILSILLIHQAHPQNDKYRFKYQNSTNLPSNYQTSCTGYRPVCRSQDLLHGKDIADRNNKTAGGIKYTLGENSYFCNENRLEKPTVMLSAGSSWESTYVVWIGAILLQELLQIPVLIRENIGASHQFYPARQPVTETMLQSQPDALNKIDQSRFTGLEVANEILSCDPQQFENISIMPEYEDYAECIESNKADETSESTVGSTISSKCKPCQHAILDVWGGAADEVSK